MSSMCTLTIDRLPPAIAAQRLYDAECALHAAHQSHLDAWIASASDRLHDTLADYLAALADPRPSRTLTGPSAG